MLAPVAMAVVAEVVATAASTATGHAEAAAAAVLPAPLSAVAASETEDLAVELMLPVAETGCARGQVDEADLPERA